VHRCLANTRDQLEFLASLEGEEELEFWTSPSMHRPVDIMTVPGVENTFLDMLGHHGIQCETYIQDVERLVEEERMILADQRRRDAGNFSLTTYHDYYEIMEHLDSLAMEYEEVETEVCVVEQVAGKDLCEGDRAVLGRS